MFCPKCGQQQASEETRFCSRCGLQLGLVPEMIAHGGMLPQLTQLMNSQKKTILNKKNGVVFSLFWFIFFVPFLASVFGGVLGIDELGALCALIGVFGGLIILLASLIWLPSSKPKFGLPMMDPTQTGHGLYGNPQHSALPPQQSQPVSSYAPPAGAWKAPDTDDMTRRGSVTDNTTRLLERDE